MAYETFHSQNYDGVTPPALPSGWQAHASYDTSAAQSRSAPNSLHAASAGGSLKCANFNMPDDNGGDARSQAAGRVDSGGAGAQWGVFLRATNPQSQNNETFYWARIKYDVGLTLFKRVSGTNTQLGSAVGSGATFTKATWYRLLLRADDTELTVQVQRLSDNYWLDSAGNWQAAEQTAISLSDTAISGAGGGGGAYFLAGAGDAYWDDFLLERVVPDPPPPAAGDDGSAWWLVSRRKRRPRDPITGRFTR